MAKYSKLTHQTNNRTLHAQNNKTASKLEFERDFLNLIKGMVVHIGYLSHLHICGYF